MLIEAPSQLDSSDYSRTDLGHFIELDQSDRQSSDAVYYLEHASDSLAASPDARKLQRLMMECLFEQCMVLSSQESWVTGNQLRLLVDKAAVERMAAEKSPSLEHLGDQLAAKLRAAFEAEPVEDGVEHPAEQIIHEALLSGRNGPALDWLETFCLNTMRPSFAASTLRCLGRLTNSGPLAWRLALVRNALMLGDAELRDAAVQAAESWGERVFAEVLEAHDETEQWLNEYICDVIDDLGE